MDHGMGEAEGPAPELEADSMSLFGGVALGLGIMIGAGIFVLTGQAAGLAGDLFPVAFLTAAVVVTFSAYSYVKLSHEFPSSGGPAMFLRHAYGLGTATGVFSLFMYVSMVLGQSLVARTFGAYILQVVDLEPASFWVPALAVALLAFAFVINIAGNRAVQASEGAFAAIKIGGLALFAIVGLWFIDSANFTNGSPGTETNTTVGFLAAVALVILAYKGFTVITTTGAEIVDPRRNIGRADHHRHRDLRRPLHCSRSHRRRQLDPRRDHRRPGFRPRRGGTPRLWRCRGLVHRRPGRDRNRLRSHCQCLRLLPDAGHARPYEGNPFPQLRTTRHRSHPDHGLHGGVRHGPHDPL
jgi:hypothetical protein